MKADVRITERETGGKVEITMQDGSIFRITFHDKYNFITVNTVEGAMEIRPSVSNEVRIETIRSY
jgi:hypothetical protein